MVSTERLCDLVAGLAAGWGVDTIEMGTALVELMLIREAQARAGLESAEVVFRKAEGSCKAQGHIGRLCGICAVAALQFERDVAAARAAEASAPPGAPPAKVDPGIEWLMLPRTGAAHARLAGNARTICGKNIWTDDVWEPATAQDKRCRRCANSNEVAAASDKGAFRNPPAEGGGK